MPNTLFNRVTLEYEVAALVALFPVTINYAMRQ